jgi:hypothetical protein
MGDLALGARWSQRLRDDQDPQRRAHGGNVAEVRGATGEAHQAVGVCWNVMVAGRTRPITAGLIVATMLAVVGLVAYLFGVPSQHRHEHVVWQNDFSAGDFSGWSWWGQGQGSIWGHISVVTPASVGVPKLSGRYVARFQTTRADLAHGRLNAKLYKWFDVQTPDGQRSPSDVSGNYSASYYLPRSFQMRSATTWINLFQFKEQYQPTDGPSHSDPLWWVQVGRASWAEAYPGARWVGPKPSRPDAPVLFLNHWNNGWHHQVVFAAAPIGRWFQITAALHQDDRIDFYLDGHSFARADASEYPVSPFHARSQSWIFGVGDYGDANAGPLYVGRASFSTPAVG